MLIGSREEASTIFGLDEPHALRAALDDGPAEIVLTDGDGPAFAVAPDGDVAQPVPEARVRNAGGAGDAFAGAYLAASLRGHPPPLRLAWGVAAATLSVQHDGCARGYPNEAETRALLADLPPGWTVHRSSRTHE